MWWENEKISNHSIFSFDQRYSLKLSTSIDLDQVISDGEFSYSLSPDFKMGFSLFEKNHSFEAEIFGNSLNSSTVSFKLGNLKTTAFYNRQIGTTNDPLRIVNVDTGKHGLEVNYDKFRFVLYTNSGDKFGYLNVNFEPLNSIFVIRDGKIDVALNTALNTPFGRMEAEVIQTDIVDFSLEKSVLYGGFFRKI